MVIAIVLFLIVLLVAAGSLAGVLHQVRKNQKKEYNKKVAIFDGKLVNQRAEGTFGYGILYGENMSNDTNVYLRKNQEGEPVSEICLQEVGSGRMIKKSFSGILVVGRGDRHGDSEYLSIVSPDISRRHCQFYYDHNRLYICDMGSKNHTFLNGGLISQAMPVKAGDIIRLGSTEFRIVS